ncbi:MAG: carbohydrate ABC transporter permease [Bacilli bacterium]|nr:carbohydrate ABC transporter permease [Bacilli bacterium]
MPRDACVNYSKKRIKVGRFFAYFFLILLAFTFIFPYVWLIFSSLKTPEDIFSRNFSILPIDSNGHIYFNFVNYVNAVQMLDLGNVFLKTFLVCTLNTILNLFLNALTGYAFARIDFKGKKIAFAIMMATMMIPGAIMTIPNVLICSKLGIIDELPVLILPFVMSVYNCFLMRQQFLSLNKELEEAAIMDGANHFKIFFSIGLPMVSPMLVVLGITTFMWNYSNFMWTVFAIPTNSDAYTLAKVLGDLISAGSNNANLYPQMLAASVLTSLPLIIIFFFLQRFIFEGISLGGVKE